LDAITVQIGKRDFFGFAAFRQIDFKQFDFTTGEVDAE